MVSPSHSAAMGGCGGHVPGHESAGGAGEAAVGEQGDRLAQPLAHEGRRHAEHLAHPGPALGALVPDHDDVPVYHVAGLHSLHGLLLGFVDTRGALVMEARIAGNLDNTALGGQVTLEDHEPTRLVQAVFDGDHHVLVRDLFDAFDLLGYRAAGGGDLSAVHETSFDEAASDEPRAAYAIEVHGSISAAGLEVGDDRGPFADPLEV